MNASTPVPPVIAGFQFVRHLDSGGFADVFLYEQQNPKTEVAVKVLRAGEIAGGREAFAAEADIMASVSHHPFIVQVFQAGITGDGRPYFVMEYYPGKNFSVRARSEQIPIAEVLRVGVQLASAVETAHQARVLHRDIKPANILTNRYNQPGLADFGIASPAGGQNLSDGMSVPYAPPEAFGAVMADERSDVYSLAATVYTLLVGRSPFEIKGGDNSQIDLMNRIEHSPLPPTGRADVPASLENVLRVAMAKDRDRRTSTAAGFGRALNQIEAELKLGQTALLLEGAAQQIRLRTDDIDEDSTRIKGVKEINPQLTPIAPDFIDSVGEGSGGRARGWKKDRTDEGQLPEEGTIQRGRLEAAPSVSQPDEVVDESPVVAEKRGRSNGLLVAVAAGVVVLLGVGTALLLSGGGSDDPIADTPDFDELEVNDGTDVEVQLPPKSVDAVDVVTNADGTFTVSWAEPEGGLTYVVTPDGEQASAPTSETSAIVATSCAVVETMDGVGLIGAGVRGCAP